MQLHSQALLAGARWALVATAVVAHAEEAAALSQGEHRDISAQACRNQSLPSAFCDEVAAAAYNVDHHEWDDLAAHAQPEAGASQCQAAGAAVSRIRTLALEMRAISEASTDYDPALAIALGRALHTIQDNCAHSGMPNPQHAWFSLSDSCEDTEDSPDIQPQAVACAEQESARALQTFAQAIAVGAPPFDPEQPHSQYPMYFPPRGGVCAFLKSADSWDGIDRRWNNEPVIAALGAELEQVLLLGPSAAPVDVCSGGESVLIPASPAAPVDTSQPIEWCTKLVLYCAGKTDGASDAPPWEGGPSQPSSTPEASTSDGGGCSVPARSGATDAAWPALVLVAFCARRRRRS